MGEQNTDSGGFSQPDPAVTDDENDDAQVQLLTERGEGLEFIDDDVDCRNCQHFDVCAIYKGIAPMFDNWPQEEHTGDTPPVDPNNLAIICELFELDEAE